MLSEHRARVIKEGRNLSSQQGFMGNTPQGVLDANDIAGRGYNTAMLLARSGWYSSQVAESADIATSADFCTPTLGIKLVLMNFRTIQRGNLRYETGSYPDCQRYL